MTQPNPFTLERLLSPAPISGFLSEYWEQRPLALQRHDPAYYHSLLTSADVDRLVTTSDLTYPEFRLVRSGEPLPLPEYTRTTSSSGGASRRVADPDRIVEQYRNGATVILQGLHRSWTPLATLCRSLEAVLSHPTQTNIYVTPPRSQGFAPHYDTHDVFILQIDGSKHWRLYDSPVALPDRTLGYQAQGAPAGQLLCELDLAPGDLLYLPRGFIHEALTSEQRSIHITLGITGFTWTDLLAEAVSECRHDERFRRNLPPGFAASDELRSAMAAELAELARELTQPEAALRAVDRIIDRFINTRRPITSERLFLAEGLAELRLHTPVRRRPEVLYRLRSDGERVRLTFHGKEVELPAYAAASVAYCTREQPFCAADLPEELDAPGKLVLVRRLLREGLLGYV
ncbi:MAG: cupin domain-containing protein [Actinomycetota bacterium]